MATMQGAATGPYRIPVKKSCTFLQAFLFYALCPAWEIAERLHDKKVVAEVKLRAALYKLPSLVSGAAFVLKELRAAKLASCVVLSIALLLVPANAAFNAEQGSGGTAFEPAGIVESIFGSWRDIGGLLAEAEDSGFFATPVLPLAAAPANITVTEPIVVTPVPVFTDESADYANVAKGRRLSSTYIEIDSESGEGLESIPVIGQLNSPFARNYIWPAKGPVTSSFGRRKITIGSRNHMGVDIGGYSSQPIYAAGDGEVVYAGYSDSYGNYIRILHDNGDETLYAHCQALSVRKGRYVKQGAKIATMGSTGTSTGVHLHFELKIGDKNVNPVLYLPEPAK